MTTSKAVNKFSDYESFKTNPFLTQVLDTHKPGTKKIIGKTNDELMLVSQKTGELLNSTEQVNVGFFKHMEVDKTEFLKLYVNGVSAIAELSNAGNKVFKIVCTQLQNFKDQDQVILAYNLIDDDTVKISKPTFYKGLAELLEKKFIAKTNAVNVFFINPSYIFNGDRLAFIRSYSIMGSNHNKNEQLTIDDQMINQGKA